MQLRLLSIVPIPSHADTLTHINTQKHTHTHIYTQTYTHTRKHTLQFNNREVSIFCYAIVIHLAICDTWQHIKKKLENKRIHYAKRFIIQFDLVMSMCKKQTNEPNLFVKVLIADKIDHF